MTTLTLLTTDAILTSDDIKRELVPIPEWGGKVYVRVMTGLERDAFEVETIRARDETEKSGHRGIRARLAVFTVCDDHGQRLFSDKHLDALGKKSSAALDRIFAAASRLNRLRDSDVEELLGNSDGARSADSGTS